MKETHQMDPKGLIREAYRIDGITAEDCRTIFLDWALTLPVEVDNGHAIETMLELHGIEGHPMTKVLREGLNTLQQPRRRGGASGRGRSSH
ncbi:hypothetical protein SAMN05421853_1088 [Roseivivax halotolerans]|uniref:Uncharacterized protein n=1 Tax=Roseivivax halotolerans TaxID=93684 RepID=A0A1I5Z5K4_9RHOB|nr:hypothetical protein [Roseivivax halotolerans]SFQ51759.1 hypothetical protein SAMN05421853_1088 [Roseivivax halotolerans]